MTDEVSVVRQSAGSRHRQNQWRKVMERDGGRCYLCGIMLVDDRPRLTAGGPIPLELATLDHVIPRSKGGGNTVENLRACCWGCNSAKDDMLLTEIELPNQRMVCGLSA